MGGVMGFQQEGMFTHAANPGFRQVCRLPKTSRSFDLGQAVGDGEVWVHG